MTNRRRKSNVGFGGSIIAIVMLLAFLAVAWFAVKGIFSILSFVAPFLLIITILIKRSVITDYMRFLGSKFRENVGIGALYGIGTFIAFPLVCAYLFVKALIAHQLEKKFGPQEPEFNEYEVVEEEVEDEDFLELPEIEKVKQSRGSSSTNEYEDLF